MYKVETRHHRKAWRNGDLEDELVLIESKNFRTMLAAKTYIEDKVKGKAQVQRDYRRGRETSVVVWFTGETWQHENSGAKMYEYYEYRMKKTTIWE